MEGNEHENTGGRGFVVTYLVMVSNHNDSFESIVTVQRLLKHQRNKRLYFENLCSLFHEHIVVL